MFETLFAIVCFICLFLIWGLVYLGLFVVTKCRKAIEKQIELGNKVFCFYTVKDIRTKEVLIAGTKWCDVSGLVLVSTFNRGIRKIFVYQNTETINGTECEITYYANEPEEEPYFIVEPAGEKLFNENSNAQF